MVGSGHDTVVVELKSVAGGRLGPSEEQQTRNYMKILKVKQGLLINFPQPGRNATGPEIKEVKEVPDENMLK